MNEQPSVLHRLNFDQGIEESARFLDRERHLVDGRAARRLAAASANAAALGLLALNE